MTRSRTSFFKICLALAVTSSVGAAACAQIAGIEERDYVGGGSGGTGNGTVVSALCKEYCDVVLDACQFVYTTRKTCEGVCMKLEPGDENEPGSTPNSVACRLNAARLAGTAGEDDKDSFCQAAGPGGNGQCGTNCESYCHLVEATCGDHNAKVPDCVDKCAAFGDSKRFDVVVRDVNNDGDPDELDHSGATVQCRLGHVSTATVSDLDAETHCPHADFHPSNWCYDPAPSCTQYCRVIGVACQGEHAQYEDDDQCMDTCNALELGDEVDNDIVDTIGCRTWHGISSLSVPETHCSHAGPTGDGHCGKDVPATDDKGPQFAACRPYCRLLEAACESEFDNAWDDQAACVEECDGSDESFAAALDQLYTVDKAEKSGDTLLCRTLHAVRAFEDPSQCAAAFGSAPCN